MAGGSISQIFLVYQIDESSPVFLEKSLNFFVLESGHTECYHVSQSAVSSLAVVVVVPAHGRQPQHLLPLVISFSALTVKDLNKIVAMVEHASSLYCGVIVHQLAGNDVIMYQFSVHRFVIAS